MKKLAIIGSGDLGQLIAHHAKQSDKYTVVGYFDDTKTKGEFINGIKVLGTINEIENQFHLKTFDCLIIGIGYHHFEFRKLVFEKFVKSIPFATIINSSCYIDKSCKIGVGVFLLPGCVLDFGVVLGDNVLLNTGCIIAHHSIVGNHSFLSPGVKIAGKSEVGECCFIGINSTIIDNVKIENYIQTGGGSVIIKNLIEPGLYLGVPAKLIKKKI